MKRILFIIVLFISLQSHSQYQWDYGWKVGAANYLGDIGGKDLPRQDFVWDMHLGQTRWSGGTYARYKMSKRLAFAANMDYLRIQDADKYSTYIPRRARNLNFRNDMFELGVRAELTVWYDNDVGNRGYYNPDYKLYVFGGVSAFYNNPKARLVYDGLDTTIVDLEPGEFQDNTWYSLRDLRTEGKSYSAVGVALPLGVGMYFTFNKEWRFGWEINWRTTFTDYLDDVSSNYNEVNPLNPENIDLAYDLQSQTYPELIAEMNALRPEGGPVSLQDFAYQNPPSPASIRGYDTNNDSYITSQFTVGKVVRGRSKFYRSKYSWVGNRRTVKRSRAKF